jgi:hypothetical protein
MSRNESFLSFARSMNFGMFPSDPISANMRSTASFAPPCAGPHREAMPAAMQAKGLACERDDGGKAKRPMCWAGVGVQDGWKRCVRRHEWVGPTETRCRWECRAMRA